MPRLYDSEDIDLEDKLMHMHFFLGSADWYAAEYCPRDRQFFGYAVLNDLDNAEWGYFGLDQLAEIRIDPGFEVDRDLYWKVQPFRDVYADLLRRYGR